MRKELDKLVAETKRPVAIFDLDGTVFDVNYRHIEILKRFAQQAEIRAEYREQVAMIEKLKPQDFLYSIEATLNQAGIDRYSERAAHFIQLVERYWYKHFFTDELVTYDVPFAGALECVKYFHTQGAHIVYLSGRDIPNMSKGTILAFEKHGFPHTGHGVTIFLKPAYGQDDLLFKKQALETIAREGEVVATFDNEPANVQLFIEAYPKALNYHFDTQYARKLDLKGPNFRRIKSFTELGFSS